MRQLNLSKKYFILIISLFVIIGFALYANTFQNQMFWDDNDFILNNQFIKNWQYFPKLFSENVIAGAGLLSNYWRPILLCVFSIEWHLWKDWAPGYHFVNTSFHIIDAILLFLILFYIFKNRWLALLTALIFLVHPLQTEAVTYVNSLGDSLSVFFIFLGILLYLKFRLYFLSFLMYILALMSKETAIVMPAFIFIADFFFLSSSQRELSLKEKLKTAVKTIWPFLILAGVYILLRITVLNFINTFNLYDEENIFTSNFYVRLFTFFKILTIYFRLLFWPANLHMERSVEIATSLFSLSVIFGGLIFLGLLVLAFTKFKRFPILSFGILWFFIGLAPTSNLLVPISGLLYEHWLYVPMIGVFLILIWLGIIIGKKYKIQKPLLVIFIILLILLSIQTINRNRDWRDPIIFYNQTLKYAPDSYRVINNLGMAYADKGAHEQAEKLYKRAINLDPTNPVAYHNLGNTYKETNKKDLAIENFQTAIKLDPKFIFSYNALLSIYLEDKEYEKAQELYEKIKYYYPDF
jgi:tetratricopeptide (TPR) repeat protein